MHGAGLGWDRIIQQCVPDIVQWSSRIHIGDHSVPAVETVIGIAVTAISCLSYENEYEYE